MEQKLLVVFIFLFGGHSLWAQTPDSSKTEPPKLFLNCPGNCFQDFVKTELSLFDIVRDQAQADIQVLVIDADNAGGGKLYTLTFIGQNHFQELQDTLTFSTKASDTEAIIQKQLIQKLKQGLIRYLARTDLADEITLEFKKRTPEEAMVAQDKWNYWVFTPNISGTFQGESNSKSMSLDNSFSAKRITNKARASLDGYFNYDNKKFKVNEKDVAVGYTSYGLDARYVKSFTEHWSSGLIYSFYHSVYENIRTSQRLAPALEYNLFPYSENIRRQFRLAYQIGYNRVSFLEETVYNRTRQLIPYHKFSVVVDYTQTWGNVNTVLNASTFLNDFQRNRLSLDNQLTIRVAEGLSVTLSGSVSLINDQISLAKATGEEDVILLGGRQLPTKFFYYSQVGISYTFGSTNNSVVNVRLNQID
ncbi:hypothetical protein [Adhaeribacter radiodurans]|uniref:DUF481 domain-containing protein n=1 Tax=Adhaeribacter radiodurans TaxID=2745197 RepID=A0A7L7LAG2_9BACT|nr:hypothetical protein [Adhaeribacter radiodurans]QMU29810.1 hypothetical protein HUW48_18065 [Adhaeribacter radiodurans]